MKKCISLYLCFFILLSCEVDENNELLDKIFDHDINMLICYGQSNSSGSGAIDNTDFLKNTISFKGGCNESMSNLNIENDEEVANFYGKKFVDINTLKRNDWPPISAVALTWIDLIEKEDNLKISNFENRFLLSTPGSRGSSIDELSQGTNYYKRLLFSVKKAHEFSIKQNKSFNVPNLFWVQGESDMFYSEFDYYQKLNKLFNDLNSDIKNITHQDNDIIFIISQTATVMGNTRTYTDGSSHTFSDSGPSFAQLKLSLEKDNVFLGGSMYQYEYSDFWHPKDISVVGIQSAIVAKRILNDKKPVKVFFPISNSIIKNSESSTWILKIKFDVPNEPMRFDLSASKFHNINGKQINFGFSLLNSNNKNIIKNEPYIFEGNTLVIECIEDPFNSKLSYALNGHKGGGNLCDSQNIKINIKNEEYLIDNFCPSFKNYVIN